MKIKQLNSNFSNDIINIDIWDADNKNYNDSKELLNFLMNDLNIPEFKEAYEEIKKESNIF